MGIIEVILLVVLLPFFFCFWTVVFVLLIIRSIQKVIKEKLKLGKKNKMDKEGKKLEDVV